MNRIAGCAHTRTCCTQQQHVVATTVSRDCSRHPLAAVIPQSVLWLARQLPAFKYNAVISHKCGLSSTVPVEKYVPALTVFPVHVDSSP